MWLLFALVSSAPWWLNGESWGSSTWLWLSCALGLGRMGSQPCPIEEQHNLGQPYCSVWRRMFAGRGWGGEVGRWSGAVPALWVGVCVRTGELLSCCLSAGEHRATETEPRGAAGPRGPPAGHLQRDQAKEGDTNQ